MNDYEKYYQKGGNYLIPTEIFNELLEENKKYEEIIDKLKDISKNRHTNGKILWFDKDYAKTYGELCTMAGSSDTRLAVVCLYELENILKEVE